MGPLSSQDRIASPDAKWILMDEIIREYSGFRQYASGLRVLISEAQAKAPRNNAASDRSGAIRVALRSDGMPDSIQVAHDWRRRLSADAFADAVVEASHIARGERLEMWIRLLDEEDWQSRVDHFRDGFEDRSELTGASIAAFGRESPEVAPRPVEQIAEDLIRAFDALERAPKPEAGRARATGSSANRRLTLTLSENGIESCAAASGWIARQTGARLSGVLEGALRSARSQLARAVQVESTTANVRGLFDEAIALLADPRRLVD